ncbi:MAG: DUF1015 domain-containing protein [Candidatus Omnitrophota bacterium]
MIKSFRATYYNPATIKNLSSVACPPYDVISKKQLSILRKKSPYNYSNLLLADNNNYQEVGARLRKWIQDQILINDKEECLYLYEQAFLVAGKKYKRFGILGLLNMDKKGTVFPHEYTLSAPKEDRKKMIREVEANLSPIFVMVPKVLKYFHGIYNSYSRTKPFERFNDLDGNDNKIWKISDKKTIEKLCKEIEGNNLVIADGHHRFEISYDYFKNNKGRFENLNYILAYITDAQDGLVVLPTHRVVSLEDKNAIFSDKVKNYFNSQEVKNINVLEQKLKKQKNFAFGVCFQNRVYLLKLKNVKILDKLFKGSVYKKLDTYLLHQFVFNMIKIKGNIEYTHDLKEAEKLARKDKAAFILKPVALSAVFDIANKGYRLPQKSTYFYPKAYCGMLLRRFGV